MGEKKTKLARPYSRQDATGRNVQAANKRHAAAERRLTELEHEVRLLRLTLRGIVSASS